MTIKPPASFQTYLGFPAFGSGNDPYGIGQFVLQRDSNPYARPLTSRKVQQISFKGPNFLEKLADRIRTLYIRVFGPGNLDEKPSIIEKSNPKKPNTEAFEIGTQKYFFKKRFTGSGKKLSGPAILESFACLQESFQNKTFKFIQPLSSNVMKSLRDIPDEQEDFLVIPLLPNRIFTDHITLLLVDLKNKTFEYYDSKIEEPLDEVLIDNTSLTEIIRFLQEKLGFEGEPVVYENSVKEQNDSHNCGMYILLYLFRRLQGRSFDEIQQQTEEVKIQSIEKERKVWFEQHLAPFIQSERKDTPAKDWDSTNEEDLIESFLNNC